MNDIDVLSTPIDKSQYFEYHCKYCGNTMMVSVVEVKRLVQAGAEDLDIRNTRLFACCGTCSRVAARDSEKAAWMFLGQVSDSDKVYGIVCWDHPVYPWCLEGVVWTTLVDIRNGRTNKRWFIFKEQYRGIDGEPI